MKKKIETPHQIQENKGYKVYSFEQFPSNHLPRKVNFRVLIPKTLENSDKKFPCLYLNDGQDLEAVGLIDTLNQMIQSNQIHPIIVVAIKAGDRIHEYGTAHQPDYAGRGSKAAIYSKFIAEELFPFIKEHFPVDDHPENFTFGGYSLGGLSAFDVAWNHPDLFRNIGVFSGSFWWRHRAYTADDPDAHRILQEYLAEAKKIPDMRFWFQVGTKDETSDRNNNGIIDAIDDTQDVIRALRELGYESSEIRYLEVENGLHHPSTWKEAFPDFLEWQYGL